MKKVYICILISKKNIKFLSLLLKSLNLLKKNSNYKTEIVFVIEKKNILFSNFTNKILQNNFKYKILYSKKNNIPSSRNIILNFLRKEKFVYGAFLDDDCIVNKKWLVKMIKFIKKEKSDIVGGPQKHIVKNKNFEKFFNSLEPNRKNGEKVDWIATNNCFFKAKAIKYNNLLFDEDLKNIGGSDQLFFKILSKQGNIIKWNSNSFVVENHQSNREKKIWFFRRNLRYGYSGNIIDLKVYGKFKGIFVICFKIIALLIQSLLFIVFPAKNNYLKSYFFLAKAIGRIIGIFSYKPKKYI